MCGIYGFIAKNGENPYTDLRAISLFEALGLRAEVRGTHATGYYGLNGTIHTNKDGRRASEFYSTEKLSEKFAGDIPSIMIGHTRFATCGTWKDNKNNHPFYSQRFGFVHNGCVKGYVQKEDLDIAQTQGDCDSEWIFRFILKRYWENDNKRMFSALEKTIKKFDQGSLACAMVDTKRRFLYLFRNTGNPIVMCYVNAISAIAFASTEEILLGAIKDCNLGKHGKVESLKCGEILRIDQTHDIWCQVVEGLRSPRPRYIPQTNYKSDWKGWDNSGNDYKNYLNFGKDSVAPKKSVSVSSKNGLICPMKGCKNSQGGHKVFVSEYFLQKHLMNDHGVKVGLPNIRNLVANDERISVKELKELQEEADKMELSLLENPTTTETVIEG